MWMVVERVKSTVGQNPRALRDLFGNAGKYEFTGTVVDPASATNASGLTLSPFFEYLFNRASADLCAPENRLSIVKTAAPSPTGMRASRCGGVTQASAMIGA